MTMEWIRVSDQMPLPTIYVLTFYPSPFRDNIFLNWITEDYGKYDWFRGYEITHWMQLPETPKE